MHGKKLILFLILMYCIVYIGPSILGEGFAEKRVLDSTFSLWHLLGSRLSVLTF